MSSGARQIVGFLAACAAMVLVPAAFGHFIPDPVAVEYRKIEQPHPLRDMAYSTPTDLAFLGIARAERSAGLESVPDSRLASAGGSACNMMAIHHTVQSGLDAAQADGFGLNGAITIVHAARSTYCTGIAVNAQ